MSHSTMPVAQEMRCSKIVALVELHQRRLAFEDLIHRLQAARAEL